MSSIATIGVTEEYGYTPAGEVSDKRLQIGEQPKGGSILTRNLDVTYQYDVEGKPTLVIYPTTWSGGHSTFGPQYNYYYDSMSRPSQLYLGPMIGGTVLINNVTYDAANRMLGFQYWPNGRYAGVETRQYNSLEQLIQLNNSVTGVYSTYNYPTGANNGKIGSAVISGETITYQYDSLNRLTSASGSGWGDSYGYDSFGNLLTKSITAGSAPSLSQAVNTAYNQIVGQNYDLNGNQLTAPGVTGLVTYDPENRMVAAPGVQYAYDSQNKRVWSATLDSQGNLLSQTAYLYGVDGLQVGAYTLTVSGTQFSDPPLETDTNFAGRRVLVNGQAFSQDQLGSNASVPAAFFPFGEARGLNPQNTWSFATYWRDSATGLDYAMNRYYSNAYGRFMTPDPYQGTSGGPGDPNDPQSWNRYAYTAGDPVNRVDPHGMDWCNVDWGLYSSPPDCVLSGGSTYPITFDTTAISSAIAAAAAALLAWQQAQRNCEQKEISFVTSFLTSKGAPQWYLADVGMLVIEADAEGIDDRFIVALSGVESTYGKNITATWGPYNAWSDSRHCATLDGHCQSVNPYSNGAQAISGVINNIVNGSYYFQSGLVTTDAIYSVYCKGCWAGSPVGPWASNDSSLNHIYLGYLGGGVLANPREVDFSRCQQ